MPSASCRMSSALVLAVALSAAACSDPQAEKQRHFERGNEYASEHKDEFAAIEYANAVRIDPKFGEARYRLAQTYERLNNLREAFPEFIRAADALPDSREAQLKATQVLLLAGRFDDAKTRATAMLAKDPKDVEALLLRANALAALKDPKGAIAEIEQAMVLRPNDSRNFMSLGTIQMGAGASKDAEAAFRQAITLAPSSVDAHLALANYLWTVERISEAEQVIREALSLEPRHLLANRMLGVLYIATGRAAEAEQSLKAVADISKAPEARLQLADYYLATDRMDSAKALLTELAAEQSTFGEAELKLASIDYGRGNTAEAHQRLDRVLARAGGYAPALVLKAQWLTTENKLDEALEKAKAAVAASSDSAQAHFVLAGIHDRRREVSDAIKEYNEVLRLNPRASAAQVELSRLNLAAGNRDAALRHAEEAKQADPASGAARVAVARSLLARGELVRAEAEISALSSSAPQSAIVHTLQGTLHARRNNLPAARASFEKARELSPQFTEALAGLVAVDVQAKQIPAAVARVEEALNKQPDQPQLLAIAAQVYEAAGQPQRTEEALKRAVAVDPRFSAGYAMLARHYLRQQRLDEARAEFEGISKRSPTAAGPRTMVGVILEAQGKRDEAKRWYEVTVSAVNDAPVVANNLAMIYADEGANLDMALQLAQTAKQRLPDNPDIDDTVGWVYYKKNLPALAVGPLEESLKKRPDKPEVLYHLGLTYAKLGDKAKARQTLERALKLNPNFAGNDIARQTLVSMSGESQ